MIRLLLVVIFLSSAMTMPPPPEGFPADFYLRFVHLFNTRQYETLVKESYSSNALVYIVGKKFQVRGHDALLAEFKKHNVEYMHNVINFPPEIISIKIAVKKILHVDDRFFYVEVVTSSSLTSGRTVQYVSHHLFRDRKLLLVAIQYPK